MRDLLGVFNKQQEIAAAKEAVVEAAKAWRASEHAIDVDADLALSGAIDSLLDLESELADLEAKRG